MKDHSRFWSTFRPILSALGYRSDSLFALSNPQLRAFSVRQPLASQLISSFVHSQIISARRYRLWGQLPSFDHIRSPDFPRNGYIADTCTMTSFIACCSKTIHVPNSESCVRISSGNLADLISRCNFAGFGQTPMVFNRILHSQSTQRSL